MNLNKIIRSAAITLALATTFAAQLNSTPSPDSATHITRIVPMPLTISPEAQKWLASLTQKKSGPEGQLPSCPVERARPLFSAKCKLTHYSTTSN